MSSAIHRSWFWNNQSKLMAFDSLLVLGKEFSISEAGLIGVLKYGQDSQGIHSLNEPFTEESFLKTFNSLLLKPRLCTRPC